jgi:hypothetical protein
MTIVFNHFKEQYESIFEKETADIEFIGKLFSMYDSNCLAFLKFIHSQFESNATFIRIYVLRYIFTKHTYTIPTLSKCIQHAADLGTKHIEPNGITEGDLIHYAIFLIYQVVTDVTIEPSKDSTTPYLDYMRGIYDEKKNPNEYKIGDKLIGKTIKKILDSGIFDQNYSEQKYNSDLQTIFNKSESNALSLIYGGRAKLKKKKTQKRRNIRKP